MATKYYFKPIEEEDLNTIRESFASEYDYQEQIDDFEQGTTIDNPQTKEEFMMQKVEEFIMNVALSYRSKCFDNGELTQEEYSLGRETYLKAVTARSRQKIQLLKEDV